MRLTLFILLLLFSASSFGEVVRNDAGCLFSAFKFRVPVDYHFSNAGNDVTGNGTSGNPYATIDKANELLETAEPGDRFLFNGGDEFEGELLVTTSGTDADRIVISTYGTGQATINSGDSTGVHILDAEFITVDNLEFIGSGIDTTNLGFTTSRGCGVYAQNTATTGDRLEGIIITNNKIHGIRTGILIGASTGVFPQTSWVGFDSVRITGNEIYNCGVAGIYFWAEPNNSLGTIDTTTWAHRFEPGTQSGFPYIVWNNDPTHASNNIHTNIRVSNNWVHHNWGFKSGSYFRSRSGAGIRINNVNGGLIDSNLVEWCGNMWGDTTSSQQPANMEAEGTRNIIWRANESRFAKMGSAIMDGAGMDVFDAANFDIVIEYCYVHHNDGYAFGIGAVGGGNYNENITIRFCVTSDNMQRHGVGGTLTQGSFINLSGGVKGLYVHNNTLDENTASFIVMHSTGETYYDSKRTFVMANNVIVGGTGWYLDIFPALLMLGNAYNTARPYAAWTEAFMDTYRDPPYYFEISGGYNFGVFDSLIFSNPSADINMELGEARQLIRYDYTNVFNSQLTMVQYDSLGIDTTFPAVDFHGNSFDKETIKIGHIQSSGNITPDPPTDLVIDDDANTATWTLSGGYDANEHEYSINNGSTWTTAIGNSVYVGDVSIATGHFKVRVKADTGRDASTSLSSEEPFTITEAIKIYGRRMIIL